ncbi:hypothetical protein IF2G_03070 [Cordyceps javanica]|nr:hypothetical protein IF2G_03070 [Cordyceps javanica]
MAGQAVERALPVFIICTNDKSVLRWSFQIASISSATPDGLRGCCSRKLPTPRQACAAVGVERLARASAILHSISVSVFSVSSDDAFGTDLLSGEFIRVGRVSEVVGLVEARAATQTCSSREDCKHECNPEPGQLKSDSRRMIRVTSRATLKR